MKKDLLRELRRMTEDQIFEAIYCDPLTHVLNRRAFRPELSCSVAILDVDSLKYVNDNYGHQAGDAYLCQLAQALVNRFGSEDVYRLNGDEFSILHQDQITLQKALTEIRNTVFPGFSFGIGPDLATADSWLGRDKLHRETSGERAPRGIAPPWIKQEVEF
jgi:GGDEF domain-containing protein